MTIPVEHRWVAKNLRELADRIEAGTVSTWDVTIDSELEAREEGFWAVYKPTGRTVITIHTKVEGTLDVGI